MEPSRLGDANCRQSREETWLFLSASQEQACLPLKPRSTRRETRWPPTVCAPQMIDQIADSWPCNMNTCAQGRAGTSTRRLANESGHAWEEVQPDSFPATQDHPYLQLIRPMITYDPAPTLRQIQLPLLALFGELDNNIIAEKNRAAWRASKRAGTATTHCGSCRKRITRFWKLRLATTRR